VSADSLERAFRDERGAVLATITRRLDGDLALAEDVVQDAFVAAAVEWDRRGVPDRPGAWLTTTAWRKALDRLRHQRVVDAHALELEEPVTYDEIDFDQSSLDDDQLRMLFTCCHPALAPEARMALTLRSVAGLTVPEIARAFISSEDAMERRLTRARNKVSKGRIPFKVPSDDLLPDRLAGVLRVVYLVFNEGYAATSGDQMIRDDVAGEAIRLAHMIAMHPAISAPRAWALLSLMLLHAARFPARIDSEGTLFLLREQDRRKWDQSLVAEGMRALDRASAGDRVTAFHLEAGIAACHAAAASWESTDWPQIVALYDELLALTRSPVVAMNRAVAISRLDGALSGLAALDAIENLAALDRYPLLPAIQAELWREAGDTDRAVECYRAALGLARSAPEQRWLTSRLSLLV
jgi:RNA polymerase sigma-70 factor (ECF subfamily)